MRNIEPIKKKYIKVLAYRYFDKQVLDLDDSEFQKCSLLSEVWAYVDSVVPEGYSNFTIFDFDGYAVDTDKKKHQILSPGTVIKVRNQICNFCWGVEWGKIRDRYRGSEKNAVSFLRKNNIMQNRLENGENVIIFGPADGKKGRTMIASLIIKEAVKSRIRSGDRGETYNWIDFNTILRASKDDTMALVEFKTCNWLVVDNIIKKPRSPQQMTLITDLIDSFFIERFNSKLSTILVFKFDLNNDMLNIEKEFGVGINNIVESNRTLKISLSEGDLIE